MGHPQSDFLVVDRHHEDFPAQLREITPEVKELYGRGNWRNLSHELIVAVVGSRKISRYGRCVIEELAPRLVAAGCTVISGFMYGVDIETHSKVIEAGGRTIAVLGHGIDYPIDIYYDRLKYNLLESDGLFLSEWKTLAPKPYTYLQRNRIVVGLSSAVIVVEASDHSGSLHSAEWGRKLGKQVFAVPGPIYSPVSHGTNGLIERGEATMLTWEALDNFLGKANHRLYSEKGRSDTDKNDIPSNERTIITLLTLEGPKSVNEIARSLHLAASTVISHLTTLSFTGMVQCQGGQWNVACETHHNLK